MAKAKGIRVLVADDHPVVRAGLASILSSYPDLEVVGGVAGGTAALAAIKKQSVEVLLLDLRMPEMNGIDTLRAAKQLDPSLKVIVLTSFETDEEIYQAILNGADGYLLKASSDEEILAAIHTAVSGERYLPPYIASRFADCTPRTQLSSSEVELLDLLARGLNDTEIANRLGVKKKRLWNQFNGILKRLVDEDMLGESAIAAAPKITIAEVARKAGVAMSTVSRVLHNKGNHSPETRAAVMRVVREYGFDPNRTAASLAMRRTRSTVKDN